MKGFKEGIMIVLPWWIGFSIILLSIEYLRADNEINITQSVDGIELYIEQEGKDNLVDFSMQHWGNKVKIIQHGHNNHCLLYTSPSPRDLSTSRMPSSA